MPEENATGPVAAYARSCLAAGRRDRDWFRDAVARLEPCRRTDHAERTTTRRTRSTVVLDLCSCRALRPRSTTPGCCRSASAHFEPGLI
jgi:hypothetical protein